MLSWTTERHPVVDPSPGCDVTINDMESLPAAARRRLIYIEYIRDGVRKRGQLFPQSVGLQNPGGFLSESSCSTVTGLWFSGWEQRSLDTLRWAAHYPAFWGGHIYIAYSPRCDGQAEPCGYDVVTARAQIPPYNSDDSFIRQ